MKNSHTADPDSVGTHINTTLAKKYNPSKEMGLRVHKANMNSQVPVSNCRYQLDRQLILVYIRLITS